MLRAMSTIALVCSIARIQHLTLHQIARKQAGDAEAEQGHSHQNAELGGDLEIGELHGDLRK